MAFSENLTSVSLPVDGVEAQHLQIEAMKLAFADVYQYVADPRAMDVSPGDMLDENYLAERAKLIDRTKSTNTDLRHATCWAGRST